MFNRKQLIEYACPECHAEYGTMPDKAGLSTNCGQCNTSFLIPTGLQPKFVTVTESSVGRPLTAKETARYQGVVPVSMTLPNGLGGLAVPVTQDTADTMAKTFLGALIMAIGVTLAAMLGLRKRS